MLVLLGSKTEWTALSNEEGSEMHKIGKKTLSYSTRKVCLNWIENNIHTWFIHSPFLSPHKHPTISLARRPGDNCSAFSRGRALPARGRLQVKPWTKAAVTHTRRLSQLPALQFEHRLCPPAAAFPNSSPSPTKTRQGPRVTDCSQDPRRFYEYYPNATAAICAQISQKPVEGLTI